MNSGIQQYIIYGYKTTYKDFLRLLQQYQEPDAEESNVGIGWIVDELTEDWAVYGKILSRGESYDNDKLLAASTGVIELPNLSQNDRTDVEIKMIEKFPSDEDKKCKYYIVTRYL